MSTLRRDVPASIPDLTLLEQTIEVNKALAKPGNFTMLQRIEQKESTDCCIRVLGLLSQQSRFDHHRA